MSLLLPPLALYIHIPWCIRKCPYCDFNSHEARTDMPEAEYVAALIHDLEQDQVLAQGRKITSIFFGGGTPSLFSAKAIGEILKAAERLIGFEPDIEITLEANPGTFEQEKFRGFRLAGVNRLSIGVQSFNQTQLQLLGRVHNRDEALRSADVARGAGFDNFNLDLMHGLPQQSVTDALADLDQAIALAPSHLSWYQLTIEQNTAFYSAPPVLPEEDILVDIQDDGFRKLADAGYQQYEVSAYAKDNRRARHNINYWQFGDYLGIGAGAHGKITLPEKQAVVRQWKTRLPQHYLAAYNKIPGAVGGHLNCFNGGGEVLQSGALPLEFLMNALRLNDGVPAEFFQQRTGLTLDALQPHWQTLVNKGLVNNDPKVLQTTALGQRFLNSILECYLQD